jgi:hypothetical protein
MQPLIVALLQAAAADPVGDLSLNYGGNATARSSNGSIPKPRHHLIPQAAAALDLLWQCCRPIARAGAGRNFGFPARPASRYQASDFSSSTDASVSTCSTAALTRWWGRVLCTAQ